MHSPARIAAHSSVDRGVRVGTGVDGARHGLHPASLPARAAVTYRGRSFRIAPVGDGSEGTRAHEQVHDGVRLHLGVLRAHPTAGTQQARRHPRDHAQGVQAVGAGEQGEVRLVLADVGRHVLPGVQRDVGDSR